MRPVLVGCIAVVVFDALGASAADLLDFEYSLLIPGSIAIYAVTGFLAARASRETSAGVLAGALVALTDATAGWAISWAIGPGAPASGEQDALSLTLTALLVVALGAVVGLIAGTVAARR